MTGFASNHSLGNQGFPLKFILMDECDLLTPPSQRALRRIMEDYIPQGVRFILVCNDEHQVIPAVQSRCSVVEFARLPEDIVVKQLVDIGNSKSPVSCPWRAPGFSRNIGMGT